MGFVISRQKLYFAMHCVNCFRQKFKKLRLANYYLNFCKGVLLYTNYRHNEVSENINISSAKKYT